MNPNSSAQNWIRREMDYRFQGEHIDVKCPLTLAELVNYYEGDVCIDDRFKILALIVGNHQHAIMTLDVLLHNLVVSGLTCFL
jgi:hypothetical protein